MTEIQEVINFGNKSHRPIFYQTKTQEALNFKQEFLINLTTTPDLT